MLVRNSVVLFFICITSSVVGQESSRPVEGLRENPPNLYALTAVRVVVQPGQTIDDATILIRDGIVVGVGREVKVPQGSKVWNLQGKTVYPGFIDCYSETPIDTKQASSSYWNTQISPELILANHYQANAKTNEEYRKQGFTARVAAPSRGIVRGVSALVSTGDDTLDRVIINDRVGLNIKLSPDRTQSGYPRSPMGAVALARQTFYDATWHHDSWNAFRSQRGLPRPEKNISLQAVHDFLEPQKLVFINAPDEQYFLRADAFSREFRLNCVIVGSGHEYRRLDEVRKTGRPIIVPLNFPKPPDVSTPGLARNVTLEQLMHWDHAPENVARLQNAGVEIAITSFRLQSRSEFLAALRKAVQRGLDANDALAALTTTPSRWLGVADRIGKLQNGYLANFIVTDGDIFDSKSKILETWVDGTRYEIVPDAGHDLTGEWRGPQIQITITGDSKSPKAEVSIGDQKSELKKIDVDQDELTANFASKDDDRPGIARLTATILATKEGIKLDGLILWPGEHKTTFTASRDITNQTPADAANGKTASAKEAEQEPDKGESQPSGASHPVNYPLGAFGLDSRPDQPEIVVFKNATIWTCTNSGVLEKGTMIIQKGRITAVGTDVSVPAGAMIVDSQNQHITPGIIDCHSHMATDGGVNESSQAITAEVRIGDFIDARDITIYRQLAGGVTISNILHGSANPIGGQNQVIKLRWGASHEELKFDEAPAGIKFALGENVKQSNRTSPSSRYPQSRMGVEQIIRNAILSARQYRDRWIAWKKTGQGLPPRKDLELDALVDILEQRRWIHCHSYRQDEILALLRTLESFNIQIGTLQHILEGYKVADVMKQHGAMGSAFSDWWAYKVEVYDAIPDNGAIMHENGVIVSFNSDDRELARHLNHEAAKAVKYGGLKPEEALKFVTLNPAKQLRIEKYVGSIEVGKHADIVIWNGDPLSALSRCEQTWIDGRKYFDFQQDLQDRKKWLKMRSDLVQKILDSGEKMAKPEESKSEERDLWPRRDVFCRLKSSSFGNLDN